jgi:ATP-dependent RNA helicase DDX49/DBP8
VFAGANLNLRTSVITGGVDMMRQAAELKDIPHVIVATPGRLVHQLKFDQFELKEYLSNLQFLVLDEADRMLTDPTIQDDLSYVLKTLESI